MMNEADGQDQLLTCVDCAAQFTFSARDQQFYQERGYQAPRRCKTCRDKRKISSGPYPRLGSTGGSGGGHQEGRHGSGEYRRESAVAAIAAAESQNQFKVSCTSCGVETTVPFKPDPNRPVFCRSCYLARKK